MEKKTDVLDLIKGGEETSYRSKQKYIQCSVRDNFCALNSVLFKYVLNMGGLGTGMAALSKVVKVRGSKKMTFSSK